MDFPISTLIYWVKACDDNMFMMTGMWYYQDLYVPSTLEEKISSITDLKEEKCTLLQVMGTFSQMKDVFCLSDRFVGGEDKEVEDYVALLATLESLPENEIYFFDDIQDVKGTALRLDIVVDVDGSMADIQEQLDKKEGVLVNISESWSLAEDFIKSV